SAATGRSRKRRPSPGGRGVTRYFWSWPTPPAGTLTRRWLRWANWGHGNSCWKTATATRTLARSCAVRRSAPSASDSPSRARRWTLATIGERAPRALHLARPPASHYTAFLRIAPPGEEPAANAVRPHQPPDRARGSHDPGRGR